MSSSTGSGLPSGEVNDLETPETCEDRLGRPVLSGGVWRWGMDVGPLRARSEREVGFGQTVEAPPEEPVHHHHEQAHDDDAGQHLSEVVGRGRAGGVGDVGAEALAERWWDPQTTTSATIEAFQAPPAAVIPPVT